MKDSRSRTQVSQKKQLCLWIEGLARSQMSLPSLSEGLPYGDDGVLVLRWLKHEHLDFTVTFHRRELSYLDVHNTLHKDAGGSKNGE